MNTITFAFGGFGTFLNRATIEHTKILADFQKLQLATQP
jgi:hypothetical protein